MWCNKVMTKSVNCTLNTGLHVGRITLQRRLKTRDLSSLVSTEIQLIKGIFYIGTSFVWSAHKWLQYTRCYESVLGNTHQPIHIHIHVCIYVCTLAHILYWHTNSHRQRAVSNNQLANQNSRNCVLLTFREATN